MAHAINCLVKKKTTSHLCKSGPSGSRRKEGVVLAGVCGGLKQSQVTVSIAWQFQRIKMLEQIIDTQGQKYNTKLRFFLWGPVLKAN